MVMKKRIKEYIDLIFADAPDCAKAREMKEEMYANVCDRYDDLVREGKSESAAYNISISGIGDISELIAQIKREQGERERAKERDGFSNPYEQINFEPTLTSEEKAQIEKYRVRRGIMNSIAIALYIICWLPLAIISSITEMVGGNVEVASIIGLCVMMLLIVAATVLMIMKSSIKPLCLKGDNGSEYKINDDDDDDDDDDKNEDTENGKKTRRHRHPALNTISSALWALTLVAFLLLGFLLGAWHPGWMLFLIAVAFDNVIEAIFELVGKKYI